MLKGIGVEKRFGGGSQPLQVSISKYSMEKSLA